MALRKNLRQGKGFTMIEVLIAVAILAVIFSLGLFISWDFYRGFAFLSEQKIVLSVLQKSRNQAMSNISEKPHGVAFETGCYIIFEGTYNGAGCASATNEVIMAQPTIFITPPLPPNIIFNQLSGDSVATSFILTNGPRSVTISVANNGQIDVQ